MATQQRLTKRELQDWARHEWVEESGVSEEIFETNVQYYVGDNRVKREMGFGSEFGGGAWFVECIDPSDFDGAAVTKQIKPKKAPNNKDGKPMKYVSPKDSITAPIFLRNEEEPDYWPEIYSNPKTPVVITEGAKKAGAAITAGIPTVALFGVDNWGDGSKEGAKRLHPWIKDLCKGNRPVTIAYDADAATNGNVLRACRDLAQKCKTAGAKVSIVFPPDPDDAKGLDDFKVKYGDGELQNLLFQQSKNYEDWLAEASKTLVQYDLEQSDDPDTIGLPVPDGHQPSFYSVEELPTYQSIKRTLIANPEFERLMTYPAEIIIGKKSHLNDVLYQGVFARNWVSCNGTFYVYTGDGWWKEVGRNQTEWFTGMLLDRFGFAKKPYDKADFTIFDKLGMDNRTLQSSVNLMESLCYLDLSQTSNEHLIVFKDGTLDSRTGVLESHSKSNYCTYSLPFAYNKAEGEPVEFIKFIKKAFGRDAVDTVRAVFAYLISPDSGKRYQKMVNIVGPPGSGKGTTIRIIQSIFGKHNCAFINNLNTLKDTSEMMAHLENKRMAIVPDADGYLRDIQVLLSLTGGDMVAGRVKYAKKATELDWRGKFVIGSVDALRVSDTMTGYTRRALFLPTQERRGEPDETLETRLQAELPQIVRWALAMPEEEWAPFIKNVEARPGRFQKVHHLAEQESEPILQFVDACLAFSPNENDYIATHDLYKMWKAYAKEFSGGSSMNLRTLTRRLNHYLQVLYRQQGRVLGERLNGHYRHVKVVDPGLFDEMGASQGYVLNMQYLGHGNADVFRSELAKMRDNDE